MDDDEKLIVMLKAAASMSEGVVVVMAGVAYEGFVNEFYAGKFKATVRVCGDPSQTARFVREFKLSEIEDIALTEVADVRMPEKGYFVPGITASGFAASAAVMPPFLPAARGPVAPGNSSAKVLGTGRTLGSLQRLDADESFTLLPNVADLQRTTQSINDAAAAMSTLGIASDVMSRMLRSAKGRIRPTKEEKQDGSKPSE